MQSKRIKQIIGLAIDTLGMRGEFTKHEVVKTVSRDVREIDWSLADISDAKHGALMAETTRQMRGPTSDERLAMIMPAIPRKNRPTLYKMRKCICVGSIGGAFQPHVLSILASVANWDTNFNLKKSVTRAAQSSTDESRAIRDLLIAAGVDRLTDL